MADLIAILREVDAYNADREWRDQQSLQAYVFDTYERELRWRPSAGVNGSIERGS